MIITTIQLLLFFVLLDVYLSHGTLQPCIHRSYGFGSSVCVCNASYCDTIAPNHKLNKGIYAVYLSDKNGNRLSKSTNKFNLTSNNGDPPMFINYNKTFQKIIGFGGAFTDAAGINILSLPLKAQKRLLQSYFSPEGIEYNLGRVPMASCDFSTRVYSYDDHPNDTSLLKFVLAEEDLIYKIPFIRAAQKMSKKKLLMFASPWSAPAWMKTNNNMTGKGSLIGKPGGIYFKAWAHYFVKFLEEYKHFNISFWGLTLQNEPTDGFINKFQFQAMGWTPGMQRDFIIKDLGPVLYSYHYDKLKLMIFDDQRPLMSIWAKVILLGPEIRKYVSGIAVHWYLDLPYTSKILDITHDMFPDYFILGTEACVGSYPWNYPKVALGSWSRAESYSKDIIQDLNHWVTGWTDWNIALDLQGGPNWVKNFVDSPIIVNKTKGEFYKQPMFYILGHFSKFILPDSVRVNINNIPQNLDVVCFYRPDKATVLVISNRHGYDIPFQVRDPFLGYISSTASSHSIQTIVWWNK